MGLGDLLVPALGGYLFLQIWHWSRIRFLREPGYHIVFRSAAVGLGLYLLASGAVAIIRRFDNAVIGAALTWVPMDPRSGAAGAASLLSVVLGFVMPLVLNLFHSQDEASRRAAKKAGRLREIVLDEAMRSWGFVEVTLRSSKSYVGLVHKIEMALPGDSDLALIPLLSGYRHQETRELRITTNYFPLFYESSEVRPSEAMRVTIPLSELVSVRPFDLEIYEKFQTSGRQPQERAP